MTDFVTILAVLVILDVFLWAVPKEDVPEAKVVRR